MKKEQLLFIYPSNSSFIQNDIDFLSKKYTVISNTYKWQKKALLPLYLICQFIFLMIKTPSSKAIFISFGGYWSLLPVIFGKLYKTPVFIILNGTDCVSFPNYNYGSLRKPLLRFFIKYSYKLATKLLPVSESLVITDYTYDTTCKYKKQGFKYFFPSLKTPFKVIYNGFNINFWKQNNKVKKQNSFITVAAVSNPITFKLKGLDKFIMLATKFKESEFTIIGISDEMQKGIVNFPKNVKCYNFLSPEKLRELYQQHEFYLQLSINEGFGCSLCEAMLCGCIPIGSNVGIISTIIDNAGFIIDKNEDELMINTLQNALILSKDKKIKLSNIANNHIVDNYASEFREQQLTEVLNQIN